MYYNICFYGELTKIILQLSSNAPLYVPLSIDLTAMFPSSVSQF